MLSNRQLPRGVTIPAALLLTFGLTLALWLFSGYTFTRRMADVAAQAAALDARYMRAQELLSRVRGQVFLASVYVRDALLEPQHETLVSYRRQLEETFTGIDEALGQYVPVEDSAAEREHLQQLRDGLARFRTTLSDVLGDEGVERTSRARMLLRTRIVPEREEVIRLSDEAQSLNRSAFVQQQAARTDLFRATQRRIWIQLGLGLAASFVIGLLAIRHVARLEGDLRAQQAKQAENARDLQRLSAQLISAQEQERRTIARELHDEVGQVLTAIKVELAVAQHAIEAGGGPGHVLANVRTITERALHTVRDLSHLLHPALLDDLGLPAALDFYLKEAGRRHGLRIDLLQDRMDERLAPEVEAAAYRVVQEGVTNVVKHARASFCRVYLQRLVSTVLVTIEDDGVGFDASRIQGAGARAGLGLIGIRERVAQVFGTLRIESAPGRGTRLTIELPVPATSAASQETQAMDLVQEVQPAHG